MSNPEQVNVDHAFDPEARKAQAEMDLYMANRPVQDETGAVHDPATGHFVNSDQYFDGQREAHREGSQTPYQEMGVLELARELAKAEINEDRTTQRNLNDVLLDKMIDQAGDMQSSELYNALKGGKDDPAVSRPDATPMEADPETALINRVMNYKDKQKEQLKNEESRGKVDPEHAQEALNHLKKNGVPDDVLQSIPAEHFYPSTDSQSRNTEQPEVVSQWENESRETTTRDRIDPDRAERAMNGLKAMGMADERLQRIPTNALYNENDPEFNELGIDKIIASGPNYLEDAPEQNDPRSGENRENGEVEVPGGLVARIRDRFRRAQEALIGIHSAYATGQWRVEDAQKERSDRRRRAVVLGALGGVAVLATAWAVHKGFDLGGSGDAPPPDVADGSHFERTHGGELFQLGGDESDPSRLQLVHEEPGVGSSEVVTLQSADGSVTLENLQLDTNGLTQDSIQRVHEAGYDVRFNPSADSEAGRLEIFKLKELLDEEESTS